MSMRIKGKVIEGKGEGRLLGFPTANLAIFEEPGLASGVYLAEVFLDEGDFLALAVIGLESRTEVWLKDFSGDLYGRILEMEIGEQISEIESFTSTADLINKINQDLALAKKIWGISR